MFSMASMQLVRQLPGIGLIAAVLEAVVFLDGAGVGQLHHKSGFLQAINQPVPVVG